VRAVILSSLDAFRARHTLLCDFIADCLEERNDNYFTQQSCEQLNFRVHSFFCYSHAVTGNICIPTWNVQYKTSGWDDWNQWRGKSPASPFKYRPAYRLQQVFSIWFLISLPVVGLSFNKHSHHSCKCFSFLFLFTLTFTFHVFILYFFYRVSWTLMSINRATNYPITVLS